MHKRTNALPHTHTHVQSKVGSLYRIRGKKKHSKLVQIPNKTTAAFRG